jgi:ribosomal protein S18 acetylase RimI-like enzyme
MQEALLRHAFEVFHECGRKDVGLGVDAANPMGATLLYERTGMKAMWEYMTYCKDLKRG